LVIHRMVFTYWVGVLMLFSVVVVVVVVVVLQ